MLSLKGRLKNNKEFKNASWLIGGRIIQMLISLVVGVITARYLGPGNYGLVNYGMAYVNFFMTLCNLGINSIIVKDFLDDPEGQGNAIGSTLVLRIVSSFISAIMIISIVSVIDKDEPITITVVALCSASLFFQIFDTINYWFQAQYMSKITAVATLIAYIITSLYKIILLVLGKSVQWFAFASSIDYIVLGLLLYIVYRAYDGPKLRFSIMKCRTLLKSSYHFILASMMAAVYAQTDKLMLKQMIDESSVGYYSTATTICSMWVFVLTAIIDSLYPTILRLHKENYLHYENKNRQLYAIVFYVSVGVSLVFLLFGGLVVKLLYGEEYMPATTPLKIVTWYTAFSYLGVARNAWVVCENKQKYLKYLYLGAALTNVILNLILIPLLGVSGAALASLITQVIVCIVFPFMIKALRRNAILMVEAILLKKIR